MPRIDSEGSAVVVTDPKKPLAAAIANEVEIKNDSGNPLAFGFDAFPHANLGAFGDLEVMGLTPLYQASFATGIRSQLVTTAVANSATVDSNSGRLRLQTGTNAAGSAIAIGARPVSYRPGQGVTARMTPFWVGGAADSTQIVGMGNAVDGYFFGFSGTSFGICHRLNSVDTWTAQADWNGDPCDGTGPSGFDWDTSKGIPLQIKYPYLGHGNIRFYVLNPDTSLWILAHTIKYSGMSDLPQLTNPCLSFYAAAINSGNTTNLVAYVTCVGVFIDGEKVYLGPQYGVDASRASVTTEAGILTIKNATTVNGVANRGLLRLRQISYSSDANSGRAVVRIKRNVTLGGSPSFAAVSGTTADAGVTITAAQSTASYDVAGTGCTGGTTLWNAVCFNDSSGVVDLSPHGLVVGPGETLTISVEATASSTVAVAVNWSEDVQ